MKAFMRWLDRDGEEQEESIVQPAAIPSDDVKGYYVVVLHDGEVERIAQRVVELLKDSTKQAELGEAHG
jgi:hypothetical protein